MYKSLSRTFLGALLILAAMAGAAAAQYQPIPNFTGIGAGFNFRQAINQRFSGTQPIAPQVVGLHYANLPSEQDGALLWCIDCLRTSPCSAGGAGAWARGTRGQWSCGADALEADLNVNGHNVLGALSLQAANGPIETKDNGDTNWRELLTPGTGMQMSNGTAAPYLVVDESADISGHVNGQINVKAPPYFAKGDGATDDTAAIQAAVNASCATSGKNKPEVYLPATPGGLCYKTTAPILLNCSLKFNGAGWQQTQICQNYYGPTIIAQAAETGWKPPLTGNVTVTWTASHTYQLGADILDPNGNLEVEEYSTGGSSTTTCTSGSTQPTWPAIQGNTVSDNTCVWVLAAIGKQIASGGGSSWDAADPEFFNGAGYGSNNATVEIMNPANLEGLLSGLSHFTVEFYTEAFFSDGGNYDNFHLLGIHPGIPLPSNNEALDFVLNGNGCTEGFNCVQAIVDIGGSRVAIGGNGSAQLSLNKIHHVALTYDGSALRLFVDGTLVASNLSVSGNWTIPSFESFELADTGPGVYPGYGAGSGALPAFYDSLRISNTARYTSNFTPPTAKFAGDSNTLFLENFPTTAPTGTVEGVWSNSINTFAPIETSNGAALDDPIYIGNMQLSDNGIYANWMLNSTIENIQINGAGRTCVTLANNDYQDTVRRVFCGIVPAAKTNVGFLFGNQSNNNLYDHLQCDGQYSCIGQISGSGHYIMPDFSDRGYAIAPLYFAQAQALLDSPELDIEDSAPNQIAAVYSNGAYAPIVINGGQLTSGATGNAYLAISGGAPFIVNGTQFTGGSPAELLNVIANPSSPAEVRDAIQPNGLAATNAGKSWWLNESLAGQDFGVKFADLPGTVTNGTRRYCVDCDPPANPPVACTSAGTKTGAWVNGLNNTWLCVP